VTVTAAFAGLVLALGGTALVWLRRRYVAIDIVGASMEPGYRSGGRVLVKRTPCARVTTGQAVVFEHFYDDVRHARDHAPPLAVRHRHGLAPRRPQFGRLGRPRSWLLKRVVAVPGDPVPRGRCPALRHVPELLVPQGCLVVLGDNPPASLDSRQFGYVPGERLLGVVVRSLPRPANTPPPPPAPGSG
jgi:signal peptidase I